mmetsp:Transcript_27589/g.72861  ORF Transcript_27589/g.72861 Transcript_27589/m.72861 type:complete len:205 (+) Transcript_27589:1054-1668(+)
MTPISSLNLEPSVFISSRPKRRPYVRRKTMFSESLWRLSCGSNGSWPRSLMASIAEAISSSMAGTETPWMNFCDMSSWTNILLAFFQYLPPARATFLPPSSSACSEILAKSVSTRCWKHSCWSLCVCFTISGDPMTMVRRLPIQTVRRGPYWACSLWSARCGAGVSWWKLPRNGSGKGPGGRLRRLHNICSTWPAVAAQRAPRP